MTHMQHENKNQKGTEPMKYFIIQETGNGLWSVHQATKSNLQKHFGVCADMAEIFDTKEEAIKAKAKANEGIDDTPREPNPEHLDSFGAYMD